MDTVALSDTREGTQDGPQETRPQAEWRLGVVLSAAVTFAPG